MNLKINPPQLFAITFFEIRFHRLRRDDARWFQYCFLALALTACSSVVGSDWQLIATDGENTAYLDPNSVTREGPHIKAWVLLDLPGGVGMKLNDEWYTAKSIKSLDMYSCKEEKIAQLREVSHAEIHGGGKIVHDATFAKGLNDAVWVYWPPDTLIHKRLKAICDRFGAQKKGT